MSETNSSKPNVVFILGDDLGYWALGCAGNPDVKTPNIDKLAGEGIYFDNFFCASPVCSPARATILTGKIPSQHGVHDFIKGGASGNALEYLEGQLSYSEILRREGYCCGLSGKWHLGSSEKPQCGFSHWYAMTRGSAPYYHTPMIKDGELVHEPEYISDSITSDTIAFIEKNVADNKQFCVNINYTAPHAPWEWDQHPAEYIDIYKDGSYKILANEKTHPDAVYRFDEKTAHNNLVGYYASITAMDNNIGAIIDKLEQLNIRENTLIIFSSDNGHNCGQHGIWGKGNGTFSLNMFDTSVKVPMIISHKGTIAANRHCDALLSHYDLFPTILEYTAAKKEHTPNLPGKSFCDYLVNARKTGHENVVVFDEYGPVRMVRSKEWKYVHRYNSGKNELYDLINDPEEKENLFFASGYKARIKESTEILNSWFANYYNSLFDGRNHKVTGNGQIGRLDKPMVNDNYFDQDRKPKLTF